MGETNLFDLATEIAARLNADDYFANVLAIANRSGDVLTQLNKALGLTTKKAGKFGACVLVAPVAADEPNINALFGPLDLDIAVICFEHVQLNANTAQGGTGKPAFAIARRAHRVCKLYHPINMATPLTPVKPTIRPAQSSLSLLGLDIGESVQAWEVRFRAREQDPTINRKVTLPGISIDADAGEVTLSCATVGAEIYYTLDGSYPAAGNAAAQLYAAPFTPEHQGGVIRAVAFKPGWIASDAAWADYSFAMADESQGELTTEQGASLVL